MLDQYKIHLPWWLVVIIVLETLPMFAGPYAAFANPKLIAGPEAEGINQAVWLYAARNLAVGFAFTIAFALRNAPMLFILIFVRLFTDLIDLPTFFQFNTNLNMVRLSAIFVFLYYIPALFALHYLWKQMTRQSE